MSVLSNSSAAGAAVATRSAASRFLLACGVASSAYYGIINVLVPFAYSGYNGWDQAVSELSAIGAPTQAMWRLLVAPYGALFLLFAIGLVRETGSHPKLRAAGWLLVANAVAGAFWPPMNMRGVPPTSTDTLHIAFTAVWGASVLAAMTLAGAAGLGRRFARYTWASMALLVGFTVLTSLQAANLSKDLPTPWMGLWERLGMAAFMVWLAVFATVVRRRSPILR